jgi:hypothetical protein
MTLMCLNYDSINEIRLLHRLLTSSLQWGGTFAETPFLVLIVDEFPLENVELIQNHPRIKKHFHNLLLQLQSIQHLTSLQFIRIKAKCSSLAHDLLKFPALLQEQQHQPLPDYLFFSS